MADRLELRLIDDEGNVGRSIGSVKCGEDGALDYVGSRIVRDVLESVATRRAVTLAEAFALIYEEPWGNQKMFLGPASRVLASKRSEFLARVYAHQPGQHDQDDHAGGKGKGALSKMRTALVEAMKAVPGARDDHAYTPSDDLSDGRYFDWSSDRGDSFNRIRQIEMQDSDEINVSMSLDTDERRQLVAAMGVTIMRDEATESSDPMTAALLLTAPRDGLYLNNVNSDIDIDETGRYFDWSDREDDGGYRLEVGHDDEESAVISLSPEEFKALHASLVLSILEDENNE